MKTLVASRGGRCSVDSPKKQFADMALGSADWQRAAAAADAGSISPWVLKKWDRGQFAWPCLSEGTSTMMNPLRVQARPPITGSISTASLREAVPKEALRRWAAGRPSRGRAGSRLQSGNADGRGWGVSVGPAWRAVVRWPAGRM